MDGEKKVTLVVAGNYRQFRYYYPQPDRRIIFVDCVDRMRGIHGAKVVKVGTWYERPDLEEIEREIPYVEFI